MAKILYAPGIEEVSGALSKINTKSIHKNDGNMFLATHRRAATVQNCSRAYYRKYNNLPWSQTTTISQATESLRLRFTEVQAGVNSRAKDLNKITADQEAFMAIREDVRKKCGVYPTMKIFLWSVVGNEWNGQHGGETYQGEYPTADIMAAQITKARQE